MVHEHNENSLKLGEIENEFQELRLEDLYSEVEQDECAEKVQQPQEHTSNSVSVQPFLRTMSDLP